MAASSNTNRYFCRGYLRRLHDRRLCRVHIHTEFVVTDSRNFVGRYGYLLSRVPMSGFDHDLGKHPRSSINQEVSDLTDAAITRFDIVALHNSCTAKM